MTGVGATVIARELTERGYRTKKGKTKWSESGVRGILKNEKYKGDLRLGKTFTVDPITHRRLNNFGEEEQYYIEDHHEAIISKEIFDNVQMIFKMRGGRRTETKSNHRKYTRQYTFSSMLKCGFCGGTLSRRSWNSGTRNQKVVWSCSTGTKKGKRYCPDYKGIKEDLLEKAFLESFNVLKLDNHEIALEFLNTVEESIDSAKVNQDIIELEDSLIKEKNKADQLVGMKLDGIISKEVYEKRYRESDSKIKSFNQKIISLKNNKDETQCFKDKMNTFKLMFQENQSLLEFDREIFENMIEKVIIGRTDNETGVKNPYSATFIFKTGLEMEMNTAKKLGGTYIDVSNNVCSYRENPTCGVLLTT